MTQEYGVLLSNGVRQFVSEGGRLEYEYRPEGGQKCWLAYGVTPSGDRRPIILTRNGQHKIIRNANAVVNYHQEFCPDSGGIFIPFDPPPPGEKALLGEDEGSQD